MVRSVDPAVIDRTIKPILGVAESSLPVRPMTIPGIEGSVPARILSTDLRGSSTRLVRLDHGWGTGLAGSFSADVEIFVIRGGLTVGGESIGDNEYVAIWQGGVVPGIRVDDAGTALLMTSGSIKYDTASGGGTADLLVGRPLSLDWEPVAGQPGRFVRPIGVGPAGAVWLGGAHEWHQGDGPWHKHPTDEECFVVDGEMIVTDAIGSDIVTSHAMPGTYFYRPKSAAHGGPGSECADTAITFHRAFGPHETEWVEDLPGFTIE